MFVAIVQAAFRGREIVALCAWQTFVVILKGGGIDFWGVGMLEVLWEAISGIINVRLFYSIQIHDALHGFHAGRGIRNATLPEKLLQKIISMRDMVIRSILLDLQKAHYALDRDRCLDILEGYGVGPRMFRILRTSWVRL